MPKQQRQAKPGRDRNRPSTPRKTAPARVKTGPAQAAVGPVPVRKQEAVPHSPPPPERKPRFHEAVALYEGAVRLLQRHEFASAADQFRAVISGYPEERELLERARLYLRVCERETSRQPAASPRTPDERVYAATMALNAGDLDTALGYIRQALAENPDHDHGHYIMAVALLEIGDTDGAMTHLQSAIRLNPDNLALARQDPDLEGLRTLPRFEAGISSITARRPQPQADRKARRR